MKLDDDLKLAITQMPAKEKDKLLLRLIAKDKKLVERLIFDLLEGSSTIDARVIEIRNAINRQFKMLIDHFMVTPGTLMMEMRSLNGMITAHVNTTKDKPGEVILGAFMLAQAIRMNRTMLFERVKRSETFSPYIVKRTSDLLKKAAKIHEDYDMEFRNDLNEVLAFLAQYPTTRILAEDWGLPSHWNR